ncbi:MAG: SDR family NAD(P)-dependent oxidoreductase, partial [Rubrivivax sp.]
LGLAIATGLAEAGAQVVLADVHAPPPGIGHLALPLDVRDEAAFSIAFDTAVARFGAVDILVNNAAISPPTGLWDITADEWDSVLQVNLRGAFFGCRIAGRHMRERGSGRIVNIGSLAGQQASSASGLHYAASKAGLQALTRSFALELAPHGVTVNTIAPSAIESPLLDALAPERRAALQQAIPVGRFGQGSEVAAAVLYLASPAAAYVTGSTLDLNGGRLMR